MYGVDTHYVLGLVFILKQRSACKFEYILAVAVQNGSLSSTPSCIHQWLLHIFHSTSSKTFVIEKFGQWESERKENYRNFLIPKLIVCSKDRCAPHTKKYGN